MAFTISDVKSAVQRKIHGTSLNKLSGFYDLCREASANVLAEIDPKETQRIDDVGNGLYDGIYEYASPDDLKGNKIIDLRPQTPRYEYDIFDQRHNRDFDLYKTDQSLSVEYDSALKVLRISKSLSGSLQAHGMDSLTDNGTWSAGGGATSLALDTLYKNNGSASLRFNVGVTGGHIENSNFTSLNLTTHDEISAFFVRVYLPSTSGITNMILRWGNDSSNYWSATATTPHLASFKVGWQWIRFNWSTAIETGTVNPAAIDYFRFIITTTVAKNTIRVDEIRSALPQIYEVLYYSKYAFRDTTGVTWKDVPTDDSDIVNLDTDSYNIFVYEVCRLVAQEIQGEDSSFDAQFFKQELYGDGSDDKPGLYKLYKKSNPSEVIKPRSTYYRMYG